MRQEAGEAGIRDGSCNRMVVQLLRVIQLVATWHPAGMEMADVGGMLPDRPDDVAFHNLHVIDVVQQLHPRRADGVDDIGAKRRPIPLIVLVIHLAVQELDADRDAVALGRWGDTLEPRHTRLGGLRVAPSLPVAEHGNEVRDPMLGRQRQCPLELAHQQVVIRWIIEAARDEVVADRGVAHRADQPVLTDDRPILGGEEVDAGKAHRFTGLAQIREGDGPVAPPGGGLLEPAVLTPPRSRGRSAGASGQNQTGHEPGSRDQRFSPRRHQNSRFFR